MSMTEALVAMFVAICGAGGVVTIYFKHKLDSMQRAEDRKQIAQHEYNKLQKDLWSAVASVLFWMKRSLERQEKPNGELTKAYERLEAIEAKISDIENDIVARTLDE